MELDVAFVIDETGSMGGLIAEVQRKVSQIAKDVSKVWNAAQFGLVRYRDHKDDWVTKKMDFTNSVSTFQQNVSQMTASGGGDFPEAMTDGLSELLNLSWRKKSRKLAFVIADAPPHAALANCGDDYPQICPCNEDWKDQMIACKEVGIIVHMVFVGTGMQRYPGFEELFKKMAKLSGGEFLAMDNVSRLMELINGASSIEEYRLQIRDKLATLLSSLQNDLLSIENEQLRFERFFEEVKSKKFALKTMTSTTPLSRQDLQDFIGDFKRLDLTNISQLFPTIGFQNPLSSGLFTKDNQILPLTHAKISVKILSHATAIVEMHQTFHNFHNNPLECTYQFPLDENSAVFHFEAKIGGKTIIGKCLKKEDAQNRYSDSISKGHGAYLLEKKDSEPDIFVASVGNLPGGASATVGITWSVSLMSERREVNWKRFLLPASVVPARIASVEGKAELDVEFSVEISKKVLKEKSMKSLNHPIDIVEDKDAWIVTFSKKIQSLNHDFVMEFPLEDSHDVISGFHDKNSYWMMCNLPLKEMELKPTKNHIILVMDLSASMTPYFDTVRKAVIHFLSLLKASKQEIKLQLVTFGSKSTFPLQSDSWLSVSQIDTLISFIEKAEPNQGGSKISNAMKLIQKLAQKSENVNVVLLSDGLFPAKNTFLSQFSTSLSKFPGKIRIFPIGFGPIQGSFLSRWARVSGGFFEAISVPEQFKEITERQYRRVTCGEVVTVNVECEKDVSMTIMTKWNVQPIFSDADFVQFCAVFQTNEKLEKIGNIKVSCGNSMNFPILFSEFSKENSQIKTAVAHHLLKMYETLPDTETPAKILEEMALDNNLVSKYTSFFAEEERKDVEAPTAMTKTDVTVEELKATMKSTAELFSDLGSLVSAQSESIDRIESSVSPASYSSARSFRRYSSAPSYASIALSAPMSESASGGSCCGGGGGSSYTPSRPSIPTPPPKPSPELWFDSTHFVPHDSTSSQILENSSLKKSRISLFSASGSSAVIQPFKITKKSIGVDFNSFKMDSGKGLISVQLWDCALAQNSLMPAMFRGSSVLVVMYDVTNRASFESVTKWIEICAPNLSDCVLFLVGNRVDEEEKRVVTTSEGQDLADILGGIFLEISSKTGKNVDVLFIQLCHGFLSTKHENAKIMIVGDSTVGKTSFSHRFPSSGFIQL